MGDRVGVWPRGDVCLPAARPPCASGCGCGSAVSHRPGPVPPDLASVSMTRTHNQRSRYTLLRPCLMCTSNN